MSYGAKTADGSSVAAETESSRSSLVKRPGDDSSSKEDPPQFHRGVDIYLVERSYYILVLLPFFLVLGHCNIISHGKRLRGGE